MTKEWYGYTIDTPWNIVRVCFYHHRHQLHPDMPGVIKDYQKYRELLRQLFDRRHKQLLEGDIYHNPRWDAQLMRIAQIRTKQFLEEVGLEYPYTAKQLKDPDHFTR